jgi:PAS domain S-box-containing protein
MATSDLNGRELVDVGGDPPCWSHLFDTDLQSLDNATLALLVRELADAVIVCDRDGSIVFWNPAAQRVFGWSAAEVLGSPLDVIIPERFRQRHWDGYRKVMEEGSTRHAGWLLEVPALHRDGTTISIVFTVSLLRHPEGGDVAGIAAVIRDDTTRRKEMTDLREALAAALRTAS